MITIKTKITELLQIEYPIIQGGMIWVSGWKLASAVTNNGGFGLIGSGSMKPDLLREHIKKCFNATKKPFGVNIPLMRNDAEELVNVVLEKGVKVVFTSAGNPKTFTQLLKQNNVTVVHVVPSVKFGLKAEGAGCDAVVGEGVEAGGHNGFDEISTMTLIPQLVDALKIPVIAAGGIGDGRGILAVLSLGAEAVQIGTRFAATEESSAHPNFKRRIVEAADNDTVLALKKIGMVRMLKNEFAEKTVKAGEKIGLDVKIKNIENPRKEMEEHYYNPVHTGLIELGLEPHLLTQEVLIEMMNVVIKHKANIAEHKIFRGTKWD